MREQMIFPGVAVPRTRLRRIGRSPGELKTIRCWITFDYLIGEMGETGETSKEVLSSGFWVMSWGGKGRAGAARQARSEDWRSGFKVPNASAFRPSYSSRFSRKSHQSRAN